MKLMKRCASCGGYTLDAMHCGAAAASPHPLKYSQEDRYASYRRQAKAGNPHE